MRLRLHAWLPSLIAYMHCYANACYVQLNRRFPSQQFEIVILTSLCRLSLDPFASVLLNHHFAYVTRVNLKLTELVSLSSAVLSDGLADEVHRFKWETSKI